MELFIEVLKCGCISAGASALVVLLFALILRLVHYFEYGE